MEKIYIGSDHAGFKLKKYIKKYLTKKGYFLEDLGNAKFQKNDDYPDYAYKVAKKVVKDKTKGILFCGSSHGMCIAANKIEGTRAVSVNNIKEAKETRKDNDSNILCISGWHLNRKEAEKIVEAWLKTPFSNLSRHKRRINKIKRLEIK